MDWKKTSLDWNQVRAFWATAECGSLSAAARRLGQSQPTLSRQVAALEQTLNVALFERVGRGFTLTPSGADLLEQANIMGEAADKLSLSAIGKSESLEGTVCLSATEIMSVFLLPPILKRLRQALPKLRIQLIASNKSSNLSLREADIAIRYYRPTEPDYYIRKLATQHYGLYASHDYCDTVGPFTSPNDLRRADFLGFNDSDEYLKLLNEYGYPVTDGNFPMIVEHSLAQWEMVKQGLGIGAMQQDVGDLEPKVTRVLPHHSLPNSEVWLVAHRELKTNKRIGAVFNFLVDAFTQVHNT